MSETVLLLGPIEKTSALYDAIIEAGDKIVPIKEDEKLTPDFCKNSGATWLVSYGYRQILKPEVLDLFPQRAVNLHISLLPWNRGADPNFHAWKDQTPHGVTIHYVDEGIDTGDILLQKRVEMEGDETLKTSYKKLNNEIQKLFNTYWTAIRDQRCLMPTAQPKNYGSFHLHKEIQDHQHLFTNGWDTPVWKLVK